MKKVLALLSGAIALVACSSDDSSSSSVDPIFSQPYTELASLDELIGGKYAYVGNKIGDRKVGLVHETNECKTKDYLVAHRTGAVLDSLSYNNYGRNVNDDSKTCMSIFEFPRIVRNMELKSSGQIKADVTDDYIEVTTRDIVDKDGNIEVEIIKTRKRKTHYPGTLEIGFQAGYLRIEDHLSNYKRLNGEKVYLYFKKM